MEPLRRLLPYLRAFKLHAGVAILAMAATSLLTLYFAWVIKDLLEPIIKTKDLAELTRVTWVISAIVIARGIAGFFEICSFNRVGQGVIMNLRYDLFAHLQRLSVAFYEGRKTGELMSRVTNDLNVLQRILVVTTISVLSAPIVILGSYAAMIKLNWQLTLLASVCVPAVGYCIHRAGRRTRRLTTAVQERLADISALLQEKLSLIRIIQCFAMESVEIERFRRENQRVYERMMKTAKVQGLMTPGVELLGSAGLVLALWFGGLQTIQGQMQPKDLFSFLVYVQLIAGHFKRLGGLNATIQQSAAAAQRVFELLDTAPAIVEAPGARDLPRLSGALTFDRVSFAYANGRPVLQEVNLDLRPGETVALVGPSGAGKTTLANLIPRLYDPTEGAVLADGHDLREVTLLSLRSQVALVPQETMLFSDTVRDNIAYGKHGASQEEIEDAARKSNAHDFIVRLENGYDTVVGERGVKLSGGQRQRIAIARALLRDPRLLILDEATSSLDAASEALVQAALETLMKNRTTLIIAHRLSTIRNADRILVLHNGRILEEGSHNELVAAGGLYQSLYRTQWQEEEQLS